MIRERLPADFPALIRAMRAVHEADAYPSVWPAEPLGFLNPPLTLAAWTAQCNGEIVGQAILRAVPSDNVPVWVQATNLQPDQVAVVSRLFISPAGRGHGLARQLLQSAWARAEALGQRAILDVHLKNRAAIALYDAQGWQRVGTVQADWQDPDGSVPSVHVYVSPLVP